MRALVFIFSLTWVSVNCNSRITLKSTGSWDWGTWHQWFHCPNGMYANGMQIKYEWDRGYGAANDDTALNAVRLYCNDPNSNVCSTNNPILSGTGDRGTWQGNLWCPTGQMIIGFNLRVYPWFKDNDDVAGSTIKAACGHAFGPRTVSTWIEGKSDNWGVWKGDKICPEGYVVCGVRTQIDHEMSHDRLGLCNIHMDCCQVTDIPCIPGFELSTLASYDNSQGSKKASISYNVKSSFQIDGSRPGQVEKDIISRKILNAVDYMATSINLAIKNQNDHVTGSSLRSMVQGALMHESQASVTIEIPKKQKAVVKQLYLTCGYYRISLPKTIEEETKKEGTKKPNKKYSHEHEDHHKDDDKNGDDDC